MPNGKKRVNLMIKGLAIAFALTTSIGVTEARYDQPMDASTIRSLIDLYMTDQFTDDEDPLRTPNRKARSNQLVSLAYEFLNARDPQTALKRFLLASRMDDTNASAYFGIAYVCSVQNDLDDAVTFYRESIKRDQKFAPGYANLAKALLLKDKYSAEAPKLLDTATMLDPGDPEIYVTYSRYLADRDDWTNAAAKMNQAIALGRELDPGVAKDFKKHGIRLNPPPPSP